MAYPGSRHEEGVRVSTLELFFDLVFVFTITQLTAVLADGPTWAGVGQVLLLFGLIWWIYGGYAWLTNAVVPDSRARSLMLLVGMAGFLVMALAIPGSFGDDGLAFGLGYLVVVLVHTGLFLQASDESAARGIRGVAPFNVGAALLVIGASFAGDAARYALWAVALALLVLSPLVLAPRLFTIRPAHFVERHGLLVIIVLGESIVAIGVGAEGLALTASLLIVALLGLALAAGLWALYFSGDDRRAEAALTAAPPGRRPRLAINAFFYAHVPMLLGIVALAAGAKKAIAHASETVAVEEALLVAGGITLFLLGDVLFRATLRISRGPLRAVAAAAALATIPLATSVSVLAQLAALVALLALVLAAEPA